MKEVQVVQEVQEVEVLQRFHSAARLVLHHLQPGDDEAFRVRRSSLPARCNRWLSNHRENRKEPPWSTNAAKTPCKV